MCVKLLALVIVVLAALFVFHNPPGGDPPNYAPV